MGNLLSVADAAPGFGAQTCRPRASPPAQVVQSLCLLEWRAFSARTPRSANSPSKPPGAAEQPLGELGHSGPATQAEVPASDAGVPASDIEVPPSVTGGPASLRPRTQMFPSQMKVSQLAAQSASRVQNPAWAVWHCC